LPRPGPPVDEAEGPQIHGNTRLEIIWTIVPALILVAVAVVVLVRIPAVQATGDGEEPDLRVRVEAHQFYWQYVYPNGAVSLEVVLTTPACPLRGTPAPAPGTVTRS
jgi:cytochrome c oxidase subunit II